MADVKVDTLEGLSLRVSELEKIVWHMTGRPADVVAESDHPEDRPVFVSPGPDPVIVTPIPELPVDAPPLEAASDETLRLLKDEADRAQKAEDDAMAAEKAENEGFSEADAKRRAEIEALKARIAELS